MASSSAFLVSFAIVASIAPACAVGSSVPDDGGAEDPDDGSGSQVGAGPTTGAGGAGSGAATTGTTSGAGPAAASASASGSGGAVSASASASSGGSGMCSVKLNDMQCSPCAEQSCCVELEACGPGTPCSAYVECVNTKCPPPNNTMQCVQQSCAAEMVGQPANDALVSCICEGACAASCGNLCG